jgi:hypothetical protein
MRDGMWGPIDIRHFSRIPCMSGRLATVEDIEVGRAVFSLRGAREAGARPSKHPLPCCAIFREQGGSSEVPVVVIQIEEVDRKCYVGFRHLTGGNAVAVSEEIELLAGPDDRFKQAVS